MRFSWNPERIAGMEFIHHCLGILNECTGARLLLIAFSFSSCVSLLQAAKSQLECLHSDYDATTNAMNNMPRNGKLPWMNGSRDRRSPESQSDPLA